MSTDQRIELFSNNVWNEHQGGSGIYSLFEGQYRHTAIAVFLGTYSGEVRGCRLKGVWRETVQIDRPICLWSVMHVIVGILR